MTRSNISVVLAACIIAASLIVSALILTHRLVAVATAGMSGAAPAAKPTGTPPITQASVKEQFRAQVLAASALHEFSYGGKIYTLTDIKVNQVVYSPKDDNFTVPYDYVWQPAMPSSGPQNSFCTLSNDGYGHYYDTAVISALPSGGNVQSTYITVK